MVKTKRGAVKKSVKPVSSVAVTKAAPKNEKCDSVCWLCWLFKLMIAMFAVMIVFWLGFCFGALSAQTPIKKFQPKMSTQGPGSKFCSERSVDSMDTIMNKMTQPLDEKTGDDFDKEFLLQMMLHHEGAVEMAKQVLSQSSREDLKAFAQAIIDSQNKEIDQMKAWQTNWFTPANN